MDKRIKHKNPERDAALRRGLFDGVMKNQLSLGEAVKLMQKVSRLTQAEGVKVWWRVSLSRAAEETFRPTVRPRMA